MSNKDKQNQPHQQQQQKQKQAQPQQQQQSAGKSSKKAQKAAKQDEKAVPKANERKDFTALSTIRIVQDEQLKNGKLILIKNKKVQQYAAELKQLWKSGEAGVIGVHNDIPKAISVVEAFKISLGCYEQITPVQIDQKNELAENTKKQSLFISILRPVIPNP